MIGAPSSSAQSPLDKSPVSGGVLAARAYRAGKLVPQNGGAGFANPDLTCGPPSCVVTPVRASSGGQPSNESPLAVSPLTNQKLLSGANDFNCGNIQGFYASTDGGN